MAHHETSMALDGTDPVAAILRTRPLSVLGFPAPETRRCRVHQLGDGKETTESLVLRLPGLPLQISMFP